MQLIKADHGRRLEIPGVPGLVRRPVDIDPSRTGFSNLRSLRIYQFDSGATIHGHAEEDEVLIVVLAGSVELTVSGGNSGEDSRPFTLSGPSDSLEEPCIAYLPPHSAYKLIPSTDADVAYARATPTSSYPAKVFPPARGGTDAHEVTVLLEETTYAQRLRLRLVNINAIHGDVEFILINESEAMCEALLHVRTAPTKGAATITREEGGPILLESWDTVAVAPGDRTALHVFAQSSVLILIVLAI